MTEANLGAFEESHAGWRSNEAAATNEQAVPLRRHPETIRTDRG